MKYDHLTTDELVDNLLTVQAALRAQGAIPLPVHQSNRDALVAVLKYETRRLALILNG